MPTITKLIAAALIACSCATLTACDTPGPRYRNVGAYSEGLAPVQTSTDKWGYINERQSWVIPPRFEEAREFQQGMAAVKLQGKWGFINKKGKWL